jgi:transposase InsO family protein
MKSDTNRLVAAFRWSVIAPLTQSDLTTRDYRQKRRAILEATHTDPLQGPRKLSASALKRWLKAFLTGGVRALYPKTRSDEGTRKALSEDVLARAIELRRESPRRPVHRLVELLGAEFPDQKVKRSTLDRHLRAKGWGRVRVQAATFIPFESPYRNCLWMGDVCHGPPVIVNGEQVPVKIFGWIDCYSRLCVSLRGYSDERLPAMEHSLESAMEAYGIPKRLFVDNGKIFCSTDLQLACATLGIERINSTPGHPASRGKIERFFRTMRDELLCEIEVIDPLPIEDFNRHLAAWVDTIYNARKHSRTGQSPRGRWKEGDTPLRTLSSAKLKEAFLSWARRKVGKSGEVKIAGNIYYADPNLANQPILIRYDPFDMRQVYIHREGQDLLPVTADYLEVRQLLRPLKHEERKTSQAAHRFLNQLEKRHQAKIAGEMRLIQLPDQDKENPEEDNGHALSI